MQLVAKPQARDIVGMQCDVREFVRSFGIGRKELCSTVMLTGK